MRNLCPGYCCKNDFIFTTFEQINNPYHHMAAHRIVALYNSLAGQLHLYEAFDYGSKFSIKRFELFAELFWSGNPYFNFYLSCSVLHYL